ncbi:MAG: ABC transporter permease [Pseudolysinimonas sp.]
MSRLGTFALLNRHLGSGRVASLLVAALVGVAVLATVLAPRALAVVARDELHADLAARSPVLVDINGSGDMTFRPSTASGTIAERVSELDKVIATLPRILPDPLGTATGTPQWVSRTTPADAILPGVPRLRVLADLVLDLHWMDRVTFTAGSAPAVRDAHATPDVPLEVAISAATAQATGLKPGDHVGYQLVPLVIAGIYQPLDPSDRYWAHQPDLATPNVAPAAGGFPTVSAGFYLATESAGGFTDDFSSGALTVWIPIDGTAVDYDDADLVATEASAVGTNPSFLPYDGYLQLQSALGDSIQLVVARVTTITALLALSLSGLLGVLLAVFALGVRMIITRRAAALSLAAARGASGLQLRSVMGLEAALISIPAGIIGAVLGLLLLPEPLVGATAVVAWILPAAIAVSPIVLSLAFTAPRGLRPSRGDLRVRGRSRARGIAELAVVGMAAMSLLLLSRRGLATSAATVGVDPLLSATPLLLALAVCVIVLRLYPLPLLALQRVFRRRDGAVGLLGASRAIRDPALGFATALALVVGVSVIVFSTIFVGTLRGGVEQSARDAVGADVRVVATALDAETVHTIGQVAGVKSAAALTVLDAVDFVHDNRPRQVTVVIADTAALHAIRPDIPVIDHGTGPVPVLVSDDWSSAVQGADSKLAGSDIAITGVLPAGALPGIGHDWLLVDAASVDQLGFAVSSTQYLLITVEPGADSAVVGSAVRDVVDGVAGSNATVDDIVTELRTMRTPVIVSLENALLLAAAAALALTVLTIVLASVTVATARNRMIGVLRMIGMSPRQLRGVVAWELGPLAVTAIVVGVALGAVLTAIVTGVVDLRPFVGGNVQPRIVIEPLWILAGVGAFAVAVVVAAAIAGAVGRRVAPAGAVKMGEG